MALHVPTDLISTNRSRQKERMEVAEADEDVMKSTEPSRSGVQNTPSSKPSLRLE